VTQHPLEVELKFEADDERPLNELARAAELGPARLGPASTVDEIDRYLDTVDLRLSAVRWACRLRTRNRQTVVSLKGPAEHAAGELLHRRPELEGPATDDLEPSHWQPSPARDLLRSMTGGRPLLERFTLRQRRTERPVLMGGRRCGLLSLDRSVVEHGGRQVGLLRIVELELDPGAVASGLDPDQLAGALTRVAGLHPDPATKLEHALLLIEVQA
jgi:inorganic triphosphatase YgiF